MTAAALAGGLALAALFDGAFPATPAWEPRPLRDVIGGSVGAPETIAIVSLALAGIAAFGWMVARTDPGSRAPAPGEPDVAGARGVALAALRRLEAPMRPGSDGVPLTVHGILTGYLLASLPGARPSMVSAELVELAGGHLQGEAGAELERLLSQLDAARFAPDPRDGVSFTDLVSTTALWIATRPEAS